MDFSNLRIKNIDCVVSYKADKKSWIARNRANHIIGIKLSGMAFHKFKNFQFTIKPGCIYFLNQKDDYEVEILEKGEVISMHFTTYEPIETDSFCLKAGKSIEIINLIRKMEGLSFSFSEEEFNALSDAYKLCSLFEKQRKKHYSKGDSRLNDAKEFMDIHFMEKNCLNDAKKMCNISFRHFNSLFKIQFDITPARYIITKKINYAKNLLKNSNLSLVEISEKCGFSDACYFSKVFKRETNMTPVKFKKYRF